MSSTNQQKKKQEERNAKAVRELASLPANKFCFECGIRGVTYVNISNGSFCCMHCSGLLRGLNPPQRVKSISISTFSNEEVEKLKAMGNEENAKIWLGLHDGPVKFEPVRLDENVKQHMIQKYERRRWYVSPNEIAEQRRLLEAHQRRDSTSGISINSHKSNQSAPPNLHPEKKNDLTDLLGEDLMFPVKEEPANTAAFNATFQTPTRPTPAQSAFPPISFPSNPPSLSSHSSTPNPLQFDLFGAPSMTTKVPSHSNNQAAAPQPFDIFGTPNVPVQPPKVQDNFANFDAVFNSLSVSDKAQPPQSSLSNGFIPSMPVTEPVKADPFDFFQPGDPVPIKPLEPSKPQAMEPLKPQTIEPMKVESQKQEQKNDGPDYSALEALYQAEDEPVDFFGFGKVANNPNTTSSNLAPNANGFAKSSTIGDFGQSPFPTTNNSAHSNVASNTGLTPNPFFSMNSFSQSSGATHPVDPAPWHPQPPTSNGTTATNAPFSNWNPFS